MKISVVGATSLWIAAAFAVSGCDSVSVKEETAQVDFVFSGGVTSNFSNGGSEFDGVANFTRTGIANRLDIMLSVRRETGGTREVARLTFRFAYASNSGELPPGEYSVVPDDIVPSVGDASYELSHSADSYSKYAFTGSALRLAVEEADPGRLVATFSFDLEQRAGERLEDGQLMAVTLSGPVRASGSFDLPVEGLEFVDGS